MAYDIPTLTEIYDRITADINSRFPGADARSRRSLLGVLAAVKAALAWGLYRFLAWIAKQLFVATADDEALARHADFYGVPRKAATYATRTIRVTGTAGKVVDKGTRWRRGSVAEFVTVDDALISATTVDVLVRATSAGADGNATVGELMSIVVSVKGITSSATVVATGDEGYDQETIEDWRERTAEVRRKPGRGGDQGDYVIWAKEVPGVTRAWCYPLEAGAGTVVVRFSTDGATTHGKPSDASIAAVQAHLDEVRPVTARSVLAAGWYEAPINFSIGVAPARRSAVAAGLAALFARDASPGATMRIARLRAAVSAAAADYTMPNPSADQVHGPGEMPTLGTITWL